MPNRFAGKYDDYTRSMRDSSYQDPTETKNAQNDEDFNNMLAAMAGIIPGVAGTAIGAAAGGPQGAAIGGKLGAGVGQVGAQYFQNKGDEGMDKIRKRELSRQALLQAIMSMPR